MRLRTARTHRSRLFRRIEGRRLRQRLGRLSFDGNRPSNVVFAFFKPIDCDRLFSIWKQRAENLAGEIERSNTAEQRGDAR